jgi:type 2 lantibiotic biosynthesis protein LanM
MTLCPTLSRLPTQQRNQLLRIIARASSPAERASGLWFEPLAEQPAGVLEERRRLWCSAVAGSDTALFDEYLHARGLGGDAAIRAMSDVQVVDEEHLPNWAQVLIHLMESFPGEDTEEDSDKNWFAADPRESPFTALLYPFYYIAERKLRKKIQQCHAPVASSAKDGMLQVLTARLASALIHLIDHETQTALAAKHLMEQLGIEAPSGLDGSLDGCLQRLERYPALARVIGVVYSDWQNYIFEFIEHLQEDRKLLAEAMFSGKDPGELLSYKGDAGDRHDHGRSVALLEFESNRRLVYKPKDLRLSVMFLDLVNRLNLSGLNPPLAVRQLIPRGSYTWEEWVEHTGCNSRDEVERFYIRMGMWTRLLQFLGARDFWLDNLVSCGEDPVFIDLEMSLQHAPQLPDALRPIEQAAFAKLQETVVPIGVVALNTPLGEGAKAEDLGALTPLRRFRTPFRMSYSASVRELLAPGLGKNDLASWDKTEYTPLLNGVPALAADYFGSIVEGYRLMHECLLANRSALLSADSPLRSIADAPIRHIHRDTWTCLRMIHDTLRTPLLVDGFQRELCLEALMRVALDGGRVDKSLMQVILSEMDAFRDLDVPLFLTPASARNLLLRSGASVDGYFAESALTRICERLEALHQFDLESQTDFLRSCFSTGAHAQPSWKTAVSIGPMKADEPWLEHAISLGDFLLANAISNPEGQLAWLGLIYHPGSGLRAVDVLRPDLLSGSCGLAVLFANLYEATGENRFYGAARGALASTMEVSAGGHPIEKIAERIRPGGSRFIACGAYYGLGSQIYALRRCALALKCTELAATADAYLRILPLPVLLDAGHTDMISGMAGLLLATLPLEGEPSGTRASQISSVLADKLLELCKDPSRNLISANPGGEELLAGLPDVISGVQFALTRYSKIQQDSVRAAALETTIHQLNAVLPQRAADQPSVWANLLAADAASQDQWLAGADRQLGKNTASLHGVPILDLLETAFAACSATGNTKYLVRAKELGEILLQRSKTTGRWFPERHAVDCHQLSAMHGIGAIANYFLGLSNPARFHSIRRLE